MTLEEYFANISRLIQGLTGVDIEYQEVSGFVLRYDNAPHHPEVVTHPDHKHIGDDVVASSHPTIAHVLLEVQALRDRQR